VLILGAGPIGLATLEFTRLTGATISVMDRVQSRLDFCRQTYGVQHTILNQADGSELEQMLEITGGDKYFVVTDATGSNHSMSSALQYVAPTGALVYVGITTADIAFKHPALHKPEMTLKASRNALPADFGRIIGLIEDGTIDTDAWITHRTDFDSMIDEFERFTHPESGVIKAVVALS
jgi:threonine dehydrogenase-like Zn-dependent dehydrogenase